MCVRARVRTSFSGMARVYSLSAEACISDKAIIIAVKTKTELLTGIIPGEIMVVNNAFMLLISAPFMVCIAFRLWTCGVK